MSQATDRTQSRRAVLGAAVGAIAATVVAGIARPQEVNATADRILYGNDEDDYPILQVNSVHRDGYPTSGGGTAIDATSDSGNAIAGQSETASGVYAYSRSGNGLFSGASGSKPAVLGRSYVSNTGVHGHAGSEVSAPATPANTGVLGTAHQYANGAGVRGVAAQGRGGVFSGGMAQLRLVPSAATTHPSKGVRGDLFVDNSGRLWFCKGGSSWKQLA
jgi:hypothetical protein